MKEENTIEESNTRTRMKFAQTTKGLIQWEVSVEYDTPEKAAEMATKAITLARQVIKDEGLNEVSAG